LFFHNKLKNSKLLKQRPRDAATPTMPQRGHGRKKTRTHVALDDNGKAPKSALKEQEELKVPKSLVIRRGKTEQEVGELVEDLRKLMLPYTALHFQEDPKNRKLTLSQYATHLALPMGITHLMAFSQNEERLNMRLARTPEGPTLSFRVHKFSLNKHIKALQRRPMSDGARSLHENPPIVVTNNFGDADSAGSASPHIKLLRITFQNLFPAINVATVKLTDCRRVVLFNLIPQPDGEDGAKQRAVVDIRHYAIKATPVGVHKKVRRLVQAKLPNLHKVQDIADYLEGNALVSDAPSDSEAEDDPSHVVQVPDHYAGKGNAKSQKSALKLVEMGPRLTLELIKVEKGLGGGDILYHALINKTPAEAEELKKRKQNEAALKIQRRSEQDSNVDRKRQAADEKRENKKPRKEDREKSTMESLRHGQEVGDESADDESE
jgi:ribosome biogenesis protein SSF1/2